MKKLLFGLLAVACFSCKKDYTCECTYEEATSSHIFENTTKKEAKEECERYNELWADDGSCELAD